MQTQAASPPSQPKEIRNIVLLIGGFFAARLYGITQAPLEAGHNWRQSLTNMVARNFLQISSDIRYPRIDMAGMDSGIIGTEFPLFNYLIYMVALLFDYDHWYGRLINLTIASIGVYCFQGLVRTFADRRTAITATAILLSSIWFSFSRKSMPDTFSVSLVLCALYIGLRFLERGGLLKLLFFTMLLAAGMLSKIPAMSLTAVLALLPFATDFEKKRIWHLWAASLPAFVLTFMWYLWWVPHLTSTYGYELYFPKGLLEGLQEILPLLPEYFRKYYFSSLYSFVGFALALLGLVYLVVHRFKRLWLALGLVSIVFVLFTLKTGAVFPRHNYYIIPYTPVMALLAALGINQICNWMHSLRLRYANAFAVSLLIITMLEGVGNQAHDFYPKPGAAHKLKLEEIMDIHVPKDAYIVINGGQSPQEIYFANRKGLTGEQSILAPPYLDSLRRLGYEYIVINRHRTEAPFTAPEHVMLRHSDPNYEVYKMTTQMAD